MSNRKKSNGQVSRRNLLSNIAVIAVLSIVSLNFGFRSAPAATLATDAKPNSKFGGVQIGAISYSWRSMPGGVDNIIKYCIETGINSLELMSNDVESYLGAPANPMMSFMRPPAPAPTATPGVAPAPMQRPKLTVEQQETVAKYNVEMKKWRLAQPMSKFEDIKKMFDKAGINIHIVKFSPSQWSDEEIEYAFKAAKAMGAKGVSEEISEAACKKLGPIAEKHGMYAVFHQHMQFATPGFNYDTFLAYSPAIRFNFDSGHFFGSTGINPITIIEKYHDRIFSIHIKDKTGPKTEPTPNTNQVWGQGEMPLAEVLQYIKNKKYPIYCDIELEYDVKPWSNAVKEVKTCVEYAKQILK